MSTSAEFWNGMAEKYARSPVSDPAAFDRKIAITKSLLTPTDRVLEVGCGTGSLALRLAAHSNEYVGLDISSEMIRIARDKVRAAGATNIQLHVGAFDATTPVEGSFQGVCAYSILHLIDNRKQALQQVFSVLDPGGFFVSSTPCLAGGWIPYSVILPFMKWIGKAPSVSLFTLDELEQEVRDAGFIDIHRPDVGAASDLLFMTARKPGRQR